MKKSLHQISKKNTKKLFRGGEKIARFERKKAEKIDSIATRRNRNANLER